MVVSRAYGTAIVHPLVLLGISDRITRINAQHALKPDTKPRYAGGIVLGRQIESQFELMLTFELNIEDNMSTGNPEINFAQFHIRLDQIKQIFPKYDVVGWYVVNSSTAINKGIAQMHKTFLNSYPSALLLVFDSSLSGAKGVGHESSSSMALPIAVYETLAPTRVKRSKLVWDYKSDDEAEAEAEAECEYYVESADDSSIQLDFETAWASKLLPMRFAVESGEAERIAVEHIVNMSRQTTDVDPSGIVGGSVNSSSSNGSGHASKMAAFLLGQRNALNMLHKDILVLKEYVGDVIAGKAPFDPDVMQLVQRVLSNKPVVKNDEQFDLAMMQEETNFQVTSYLNAATSAAATVRELSQRSNVALSSARSKHAAYINPSPNTFDSGMSDMMSMFNSGDRFGRHGRMRGFGSHFR
ncbi:hypothetical protein J3B02_000662 [Coemansia erecta]|uniref:COP9 signalosome complex subunit 6 n=1 Tax=Coemansia asiatica TaxID=1052880 RepID=A0A9W8CIY8_9FUNG|nr:hypothetical protein LPJ64_003223 [Coemansia asiatica]KAJ2857904.1 hypothetical protein J3B02_000662 [Coemansia erecta]KAJ2889178.1 hypothetical protein FB639_000096 [Coemansia asiatica]